MSQEGLKYCRLCDSVKPLEKFPRNKGTKDGRYAYCSSCNNNKAQKWRERNPGHRAAYHAANRDVISAKKREQRKDRTYARTRNLRERHKITLEEYEAMFAAQGGKCAINLKEKIKVLQVDHDHDTGKIRGLLCGSCNRAIGLFGDDSERAVRAALYLLRSYRITVHCEEVI